jgi:hypothetical protein
MVVEMHPCKVPVSVKHEQDPRAQVSERILRGQKSHVARTHARTHAHACTCTHTHTHTHCFLKASGVRDDCRMPWRKYELSLPLWSLSVKNIYVRDGC